MSLFTWAVTQSPTHALPRNWPIIHTVICPLILPFDIHLFCYFPVPKSCCVMLETQRWLSSTPCLEELRVGWQREAEARYVIIKKVGSVPGEKGGTEKRLLEVKTAFLEENWKEKQESSCSSPLRTQLQARPPRSLSDSQTCPMVVLLKHLPWLPITPRIKHKLIHFAQRHSESSSCLIFLTSPHISSSL